MSAQWLTGLETPHRETAMALPSNLVNDVYQGIKADFKKSPWAWGSMTLLWAVAWSAYFWLYPKLAYGADVKAAQMAMEQKVTGVERKVDIVLKMTMDQSLRDLVRVRCNAVSNNRIADARVIQSQIDDKRDEFQEVFKYSWTEPKCDEVETK